MSSELQPLVASHLLLALVLLSLHHSHPAAAQAPQQQDDQLAPVPPPPDASVQAAAPGDALAVIEPLLLALGNASVLPQPLLAVILPTDAGPLVYYLQVPDSTRADLEGAILELLTGGSGTPNGSTSAAAAVPPDTLTSPQPGAGSSAEAVQDLVAQLQDDPSWLEFLQQLSSESNATLGSSPSSSPSSESSATSDSSPSGAPVTTAAGPANEGLPPPPAAAAAGATQPALPALPLSSGTAPPPAGPADPTSEAAGSEQSRSPKGSSGHEGGGGSPDTQVILIILLATLVPTLLLLLAAALALVARSWLQKQKAFCIAVSPAGTLEPVEVAAGNAALIFSSGFKGGLTTWP